MKVSPLRFVVVLSVTYTTVEFVIDNSNNYYTVSRKRRDQNVASLIYLCVTRTCDLGPMKAGWMLHSI